MITIHLYSHLLAGYRYLSYKWSFIQHYIYKYYLTAFVQAAITPYLRLGGLQTTNVYFSQFRCLEAGARGATMVGFWMAEFFSNLHTAESL